MVKKTDKKPLGYFQSDDVQAILNEGTNDMTMTPTAALEPVADIPDGVVAENANASPEAPEASTDTITQIPYKLGDKSMTIKSFTGVPMPETKNTRESKYPWDQPVGGSFFVPGAKIDTFNTLCSTRNKREKDKNGDNAKRYTAKKYNHEGTDGIMVWRTV